MNTRLLAVRRAGNELVAVLGSDYGGRDRRSAGSTGSWSSTAPLPAGRAIRSAQAGLPQRRRGGPRGAARPGGSRRVASNPGGAYELFRIGDAVASRNIHAAIFDGLRLAKDI